MSNSIKGFTVTLDKDVSDEGFETLSNAIMALKHVVHVEPSISTYDDFITRMRVKSEYREKFWKFMNEEIK